MAGSTKRAVKEGIMEVRHYEYRLIKGETPNDIVMLLNELATEGFRVIECAGAGTELSKTWIWTLEREILPDHPYR